LITAPALLKRISPMYYYNNITSAIQLYHGTADTTVPIEWAQETCNTAKTAGVTINCIYYPDEDHTFRNRVANEFYDSMFDFYKIYLSP
jgi:dipeptidyl aminopeptidase/acylaminoacyl peptidase